MPYTGFACPTCDTSGNTVHLMSRQGSFGYFCEAGHVFQIDTPGLLSMGARKIPTPMPLQKPREGLTQFSMSLPGKLITALKEKFKEKTDASIEGVLTAMLDSGAFIVPGFDASRLQELFGQKVHSPDKLVGLVYNLKSERDEARQEAEVARKTSGASVSQESTNTIQGNFVQVSLRLELEEFMAINGKAIFNGQPVSEYLKQIISTALSNGWF